MLNGAQEGEPHTTSSAAKRKPGAAHHWGGEGLLQAEVLERTGKWVPSATIPLAHRVHNVPSHLAVTNSPFH